MSTATIILGIIVFVLVVALGFALFMLHQIGKGVVGVIGVIAGVAQKRW